MTLVVSVVVRLELPVVDGEDVALDVPVKVCDVVGLVVLLVVAVVVRVVALEDVGDVLLVEVAVVVVVAAVSTYKNFYLLANHCLVAQDLK